MDSTAVLLHMVDQGMSFDILHSDYGQIAALAEWLAVYSQGKRWERIVISLHRKLKHLSPPDSQLFSGNREHEPIVEGRNLSLILAAVELGYSDVYVGLDKPASGVAWPDASREFLDTINRVLSLSYLRRKVTVHAPFIDVDKETVFAQAVKRCPDFFDISFTCWTPHGSKACGLCKHCLLLKQYKEKLA